MWNKEEVTLSHIDRIVERLVSELKRIAAGNEKVEMKIRKMLVTRVLFRFESVKNYSQSLNDLLSSLRGALSMRRQTHFQWEAAVLKEVLRAGKEEGVLSFRDATQIANCFIHATNAFLPYSLTPRELGKKTEIKEQVLQIADVLLHGIIRC